MSIDSDFDALPKTNDPDEYRDAMLRVVLTHVRLANDQLAEGTLERAAQGRRMTALETAVTDNTALTVEIRDWLSTGRGFFKVLGWIGKAVKWSIPVLASIYGAYWTWTHGGVPK